MPTCAFYGRAGDEGSVTFGPAGRKALAFRIAEDSNLDQQGKAHSSRMRMFPRRDSGDLCLHYIGCVAGSHRASWKLCGVGTLIRGDGWKRFRSCPVNAGLSSISAIGPKSCPEVFHYCRVSSLDGRRWLLV